MNHDRYDDGYIRGSSTPCPPTCLCCSRPSLNWSSTSRRAKALGLTVPQVILSRADEVIQ
jgi:hypothetical protein